MSFRKASCAVVAAIALSSLTGCSADQSAAEVQQTGTAELQASWAQGYPTLKLLVADSDVIVRGNFADQSTTQRDGLPYTDTNFMVSEWIKGSGEDGKKVLIRQTGGQMNGKQYVLAEDPIVSPGEEALLFLRKTPGNIYLVLGGPTGRFPVQQDGSVARLKSTSLTEALPSSVTALIQLTQQSVADQASVIRSR